MSLSIEQYNIQNIYVYLMIKLSGTFEIRRLYFDFSNRKNSLTRSTTAVKWWICLNCTMYSNTVSSIKSGKYNLNNAQCLNKYLLI